MTPKRLLLGVDSSSESNPCAFAVVTLDAETVAHILDARRALSAAREVCKRTNELQVSDFGPEWANGDLDVVVADPNESLQDDEARDIETGRPVEISPDRLLRFEPLLTECDQLVIRETGFFWCCFPKYGYGTLRTVEIPWGAIE